MLIAAYVFIGQQSHMSDMPLLHVICTTAKGNWYCLSHGLIMTAGTSDNCLIYDLIDVYLFFRNLSFFSRYALVSGHITNHIMPHTLHMFSRRGVMVYQCLRLKVWSHRSHTQKYPFKSFLLLGQV